MSPSTETTTAARPRTKTPSQPIVSIFHSPGSPKCRPRFCASPRPGNRLFYCHDIGTKFESPRRSREKEPPSQSLRFFVAHISTEFWQIFSRIIATAFRREHFQIYLQYSQLQRMKKRQDGLLNVSICVEPSRVNLTRGLSEDLIWNNHKKNNGKILNVSRSDPNSAKVNIASIPKSPLEKIIIIIITKKLTVVLAP